MSEATIVSSGNNNMRGDFSSGVQFSTLSTITALSQQEPMKKRSRPGNPDPDAEVIALSPKTLMATNRFICEICNKGFQREQNLQLHRRGHNLPWKLRQRSSGSDQTRRRVFVCPEPSCVHHDPSRALGDLTGIKKHFCRKHGEKKWKCDKCSKRYAVQSDWKAHSKICGTKEYRCDCGTLFSRKDSFITHRAFCDALAEESAGLSVRFNALPSPSLPPILSDHSPLRSLLPSTLQPYLFQKWNDNLKHQEPVQDTESNPSSSLFTNQTSTQPSPFMAANTSFAGPPSFSSHMSANALLQNNGIVSSTGMKEFQTVGSSLSNLQSLNPLSIWDFSGKDGVGSAYLHELQRSNSRIVEERIAEMESVLGGGGGGGGGGRGSLGEVVGSVRICGGVRGAQDLGHGENKEDYGKSRFTRDFLGVEISDGAYGSEHYNSLRSPVVAALRSFSSASQSWEG